MMCLKSKIKSFYIWLKRFRHRKGYGVHSPFAFSFITRVLYEKGEYYNYSLFKRLPKDKIESDKILKLLFRLVNFLQPEVIYSLPNRSYLKDIFVWAKSDVNFVDNLKNYSKIDFAYISEEGSINIKRVDEMRPFLHQKSMLVIYGIGYSKENINLWHNIIEHPSSGISFDLYHVGILFFDQSKNKQDYLVNF